MRATWMKWTCAAVAAIGVNGHAALSAADADKKAEKKSEKSAVKADAKGDKAAAKSDKPKGPEHIAYAEALWKYVTRASSPYTKWTAVEKSPEILAGPQPGPGSKVFANKDAATNLKYPPYRSLLVIEHYAPDAKTKKPALSGVTVKFRPKAGYDARHEDWYWAYFLPGGKHVECSVVTKPLAKPGFITFEEDGRLWVFRAGSKELSDYVKNGELAAHVSLPGVGPGGMTVRGPDKETIVDYVICRPGFVTKIIKDQLWVLRRGSNEAAALGKDGPPAQHVTRPLAGPLGLTLRAPDSATLDEYLNAKSGFVTIVEDGRLWVFRLGSKDLAEYRKNGELAKQVVQPGAGPSGVTIKAPDKETIVEYLTARDGFTTVYDNDRLWVFRSGSDPLWKFKKDGELAQHVVRPAAGPMGLTVKAPDAETLDWYLRLASE